MILALVPLLLRRWGDVMKYYDRYSNVIAENNAVLLHESAVKCSVAQSGIYTDEGTTPITTSGTEFKYFYTDSFEDAKRLIVDIEGTEREEGHSYAAYYFWIGELLTGEDTSVITVYNASSVTSGVVSDNWNISVERPVAEGRRLVIMWVRDYTEITRFVATIAQNNNGVSPLVGVASCTPLLSGILTSEEGTFSNLIYDFPQQTDAYATETKGALNISSDEFLDLYYNTWVGKHRNGYTVSKRSIGKDQSNTYDMYEYTFTPKSYTYKILLTSGVHAYELSGMFGLAWFMKRFMQVVDGEVSDPGFEYLMNHVCIKCIPIQNPWGFNQNPKTYYNVNKVNISRNFTFKFPDGTDAWENKPVEHTNTEWKGDAPFSEREARNLRDWVDENWDAIFWIDCHTDETSASYDIDTRYRATKDESGNDDRFTAGIKNAIQVVGQHILDDYGVTPVFYPATLNPIGLDDVNTGYSGLTYAQMTYGMWQNTVEQSPERLTWGTAKMNEGSDITEYAIQLYAYLFGILPYNIDAETWIRSLVN